LSSVYDGVFGWLVTNCTQFRGVALVARDSHAIHNSSFPLKEHLLLLEGLSLHFTHLYLMTQFKHIYIYQVVFVIMVMWLRM
jgi:hypothetical protein